MITQLNSPGELAALVAKFTAVDEGFIAEDIDPFDRLIQRLLILANHDVYGKSFLLTRLL